MSVVRTVLGDVPADQLGVCDAHDHLFFASRKLPGHELVDPVAAEVELRAWAALGGRSVVQWSPYGTGRRPADLFVTELTEGLRDDTDPDRPAGTDPGRPAVGEPVRAGVIKVATDFHGLSGHARDTMVAAAEAHHATGAAICVHHEMGSGAGDTLELLCGRLGVAPERVVLGHLNRFPDPVLHKELAGSGAFLAFDGPSRAHHATDWRLVRALVELAEAGHARQLLLGGDTTTAAARSTADGPGMPYLLRVLRPRLERELGEAVVAGLFVDNPARAFAADWH